MTRAGPDRFKVREKYSVPVRGKEGEGGGGGGGRGEEGERQGDVQDED